MKKCNCPKCEKELIRLEPYEDGIYSFWCDICDIDILIINNKEIEKTLKVNLESIIDYTKYDNIIKSIDSKILDRYLKETEKEFPDE